jgi:hypothetical protein
MNISAVGAAGPSPVMTGVSMPTVAVPGVGSAGAVTGSTSQPRHASTDAQDRAQARAEHPEPPPPPKLPPLKPLSTTEMRVMLGALPPAAARAAAQQAATDGAVFDAYA